MPHDLPTNSGPTRPIVIEPVTRVVRVHLAGHTVAETRSAMVLHQAAEDPRLYIPRGDVDMTMLRPSSHSTHSPHIGPCAFFHLPDAGDDRSENAAWSYENPPPSFDAIRGHVAFNPRCVDWIQIES